METLQRLKTTAVLGIGTFHPTSQGLQLGQWEDTMVMNQLYFWERSSARDAMVTLASVAALKCQLENNNYPLVVMCDAPLDFKTLVCWVETEQHYRVMICQPSYPERVAWDVLRQTLGPLPPIFQLQTPADLDKLTKIKEEIEVVKMHIHNAIDMVLIRGERLDDLQERSQVLSQNSAVYFKRAQTLNRCCILL